MQAHHRPEREHPEESRQNSTPPAGAESGGPIITEQLVYLPFEHGWPLVHFVALTENT